MKLYRPSNGTEADWFASEWCDECAKDIFDLGTGEYIEQCDILDRSLLHDINQIEYPTEWRYCSLTDQPICMAFTTEIKKTELIINPDQLSF